MCSEGLTMKLTPGHNWFHVALAVVVVILMAVTGLQGLL
jgi:hypothetical protein